jgi:hypothetical protein
LGWHTVLTGQSWFPRHGTQLLLASHFRGEGQSDDFLHCTQLKELQTPKLNTDATKNGSAAQHPASTSTGSTGLGPASYP